MEFLQLDSFKTPSPGRYSPEKVHPQGERHAPCYSMGARTRFRRRDNNPAPSKYVLPPVSFILFQSLYICFAKDYCQSHYHKCK